MMPLMPNGANGRISGPDVFADAVLMASHALVQVSAEALNATAPGVSLSEFRALTILSEHGPQRLVDIASALGVTSTTVTRLADGLAERRLVDRVRQREDRREVCLEITPGGRALVRTVSSQRRRFVLSVLRDFSERDRAAALALMGRFAGSGAGIEQDSA